MRGLRTSEDKAFLLFFEQVQNEAKKQNKVFFVDSAQCLGVMFGNMEIDELSGWLVDISKADEFEHKFREDRNLDDFIEDYIWCIPEVKNGDLRIEFKNF